MYTCVVPPHSDKASTSDGDKIITTVEPAHEDLSQPQSQSMNAEYSSSVNTPIREGVLSAYILVMDFTLVFCFPQSSHFQVVRFHGLVLLEARTSFAW